MAAGESIERDLVHRQIQPASIQYLDYYLLAVWALFFLAWLLSFKSRRDGEDVEAQSGMQAAVVMD